MVRPLLEMLYTGGLRVDTRDADGEVRLSSVIQLDGDTVMQVHETLSDPDLLDRHAEQVRTALQPLRWLGRTGGGLTVLGLLPCAVWSWHAFGDALATGLSAIAWVIAGRLGFHWLGRGLLLLGKCWVRWRAGEFFASREEARKAAGQ